MTTHTNSIGQAGLDQRLRTYGRRRLFCVGMWLSGVLLAWAGAAPAREACKMLQVGEVDVTMSGPQPLVAASINGHAVQMLLDTGGARSLIWKSAAKELGLKLEYASGQFYGVGGGQQASIVWVDDLGFAGAHIRKVQLFASARGNWEDATAGVLGDDLLSSMDVELDLSAGKLRLFKPKNCVGDEVVYWSDSFFMVPMQNLNAQSSWPEAEVSLGGHTVLALFDTGASFSAVSYEGLRVSGASPETSPSDAGSTHGIGSKGVETQVARFSQLTIGQETVQHVRLRIADLFEDDRAVSTGSLLAQSVLQTKPDMILGADFFRAHRVLIARSQGKIYFTYKGGPIFSAPPKQVADPPPDVPPAGSAGEPPH
ncbi:MAG: aspartyl protease family protein [Steroidobacteraceae bacterium]